MRFFRPDMLPHLAVQGRARPCKAVQGRATGVLTLGYASAGILLSAEAAPKAVQGRLTPAAVAAQTRGLMAKDSFYRMVAADDDDGGGTDTLPFPVAAPAGKPVAAAAAGAANKVTLIPVKPAPSAGRGGAATTYAGIFDRCQAMAKARRVQQQSGTVDLTRPEVVDLVKPRVVPTPPHRKPAAIFQHRYVPPPKPVVGKGKPKEELRECVVRNAKTGLFEYVDRDGKRTPCDT